MGAAKPPGAWTPEQTVDYMVDKVFQEGDFYVICPDNETPTVSQFRKCWKSLTKEIVFGQGKNSVEHGRCLAEPTCSI